MNELDVTSDEKVVPAIVAEILALRGLKPDEMVDFLYPDYDRHLHDPFLMTDMDRAVERILLAGERGERVAVYGDYDIDGITASAVLLEVFELLGIQAESYIPDRFEEGYGINQEALASLKDRGFDLVVSVDCGITSVNEAAWARDNGLDLIITDHHSVPQVLPEAIAVVNPKRPDDKYPFKDLAGVGVAFKLAQALQQRAGERFLPGREKWLLDLVALGTVCDIVTLVGENRVLVSYGLKVLRRTRRVGLRALAAVGRVEVADLTAHHLGFVLGPRMNAAGRLEHAARSLELMHTTDAARAREIAEQLDELNTKRRADQATIVQEAGLEAAEYANDPILLLANSEWSHGIVGIAASKLVEEYRKPVLIAQILGEATKGSARSVPGFNMVEALRSAGDLLTKFGGHYFAAGYTLPTENLEALRARLNDYARSSPPDTAVPATEVSWRASDLEAVDWPLMEALALLEPHGNANPRPVVALDGLSVRRVSRIGADKRHLRLDLADAAGRSLGAIAFGLAEQHAGLAEGAVIGVLGKLDVNVFNDRRSIQLVVDEIRP